MWQFFLSTARAHPKTTAAALATGCAAVYAYQNRERIVDSLYQRPPTFHYQQLPGSYLIEVKDLDCSRELLRRDKEKLKELIAKHQVVVIRAQKVEPDDQVKLTTLFGEPRHVGHNQDGGLFGIFDNKKNSNLYYKQDGEAKAASQFWHSASSEKESQRFTFLHCILPPEEGGETQFVNTRLAYHELPAELKAQLEGKEASHSAEQIYRFLKNLGFTRLANLSEEETASEIAFRISKAPPVFHPLVVTHELTGEKALFINPLSTDRIEGMVEEESRILLEKLYQHCLQDRYLYTHKWQKGDLLIWDQFFTMHKGIPVAKDSRRILQKTATFELVSPQSHYANADDEMVYQESKRAYRW